MQEENQLVNLINRLENVALRLESIGLVANKNLLNTNQINELINNNQLPESIVAFDDLINENISKFVQISSTLSNDIKQIAVMVENLFHFERSFLLESSKCTQPNDQVLGIFYQLFSKHIQDITDYRDKNRKSEYFNHYSSISESIGALSWIAIKPSPSSFIKEMSDSAQFYSNRILKEYKEKDLNHSIWVKLWLQILTQLHVYVKQYYTTGLVWNIDKKSSCFEPTCVSSTKPCGVASPPLDPPKLQPAAPPNTPLKPDINSIFAELNKGTEITNSLKKVSDDQKTHKNPTLRTTSLVTTNNPKSIITKEEEINSHPSVFYLDVNKWKIEYQINPIDDIIIDNTDLKQTVYIYKCEKCTIIVIGKVNSILIDSCKSVSLLFDDVLSTVEFINSSMCQMQVIGKVPTVAIEKTDGCQVFLSKNSLDTQIVTSKSSSINILIPNDLGDDYTELPVPEQFKTVIHNNKLKTTNTENC